MEPDDLAALRALPPVAVRAIAHDLLDDLDDEALLALVPLMARMVAHHPPREEEG